jgi:hypothetical protein
MRKAFDFYDSPGAEVNYIQTVEQEENSLSHKVEDTRASNDAIEILNSSLQAIEESQLKQKELQEKKYPKKRFGKSPVLYSKNGTHVSE